MRKTGDTVKNQQNSNEYPQTYKRRHCSQTPKTKCYKREMMKEEKELLGIKSRRKDKNFITGIQRLKSQISQKAEQKEKEMGGCERKHKTHR